MVIIDTSLSPGVHCFAILVILCVIMPTSSTTAQPGHVGPGHAGGALEFGEFERSNQGLDSFQK